jgi:hypothetical protein
MMTNHTFLELIGQSSELKESIEQFQFLHLKFIFFILTGNKVAA